MDTTVSVLTRIMSIISFSLLVPGSIVSKDTLNNQKQEKICKVEPIVESSAILEGNSNLAHLMKDVYKHWSQGKAGKKARWTHQRLMSAELEGHIGSWDKRFSVWGKA